MIDKGTFIICIIKLLALQIILVGFFLAIYADTALWTLLICAGSLLFAIGSNALLVHILFFRRKDKRG